MKIEFVTDKSHRNLGELNSGAFFCKGCGIVPASDDCPVCSKLWRQERDRTERRNFYAAAIAMVLVGIAAAYVVVAVLGK
jgi:hypothetical protein